MTVESIFDPWKKRPGAEGRERHGDLEVELIEERKDRESFIVRKMVLEYQNQRKIVTQYQFLKWPDFDVPNNPGSVFSKNYSCHPIIAKNKAWNERS